MLGQLLVRIGQAEHSAIAHRPPQELQSCRQAVCFRGVVHGACMLDGVMVSQHAPELQAGECRPSSSRLYVAHKGAIPPLTHPQSPWAQ